MTNLFGQNGKLSQVMPGYKDRPQQKILTSLINKGIKDDRNVIVEAPTGSGKSLAALIALATRLNKDEKKRKYLIVTGTINLQEQYYNKDIPFIVDDLGYDLKYGLIKGISNYVCAFKYNALLKERNNESLTALTKWVTSTEVGDIAELSRSQIVQFGFMDFTCSYESCLGKKCRDFNNCFYYNNRSQIYDKDIIVINYHYFFSHIKNILKNGGSKMLPEGITNIIFDEAHLMKGIIRDFFGFDLTKNKFLSIINYLNHKAPERALSFSRVIDGFFNYLNLYLEGQRSRLFFEADLDEYDIHYETLLVNLAVCRNLIDADINNYLNAVGQDKIASNDIAATKALSLTKFCSDATDFLVQVRKYLFSDNSQLALNAIWVHKENENISLSMKPVYVRSILPKFLPMITKQSTFMSATIDFPTFIKDLGLDKFENNLIHRIDPVFDYKKNTAFYIPSLGKPTTEKFDNNVGQLISDVYKMIGGGILCLFTSYKAMNIAVEAFDDVELEQPLLIQRNEESVAHLIEEFKQGDRILFGTKKFFQGVDFPGDMAKVVIINKLPFLHFEDPIMKTLEYFNIKNRFNEEQVPYCQINFKQAFGRLIRTEDDTGIIICCDDRIITKKGYGPRIMNSLPDTNVVTEWKDFLVYLEKFNKEN